MYSRITITNQSFKIFLGSWSSIIVKLDSGLGSSTVLAGLAKVLIGLARDLIGLKSGSRLRVESTTDTTSVLLDSVELFS